MKRLLITGLTIAASLMLSMQAQAQYATHPAKLKSVEINFITCGGLSPYFMTNLSQHLFGNAVLNNNLDGVLNNCVKSRENAVGRGLKINFKKGKSVLKQPLKQREVVGTYNQNKGLMISRIPMPGGDVLTITIRSITDQGTEGTLIRTRSGKVINRAYILGNVIKKNH